MDPAECLRYATITLDERYAQFPLSESTAVQPSTVMDRFLTTTAVWDRGLDAIVEVTDPTGQESTIHRDGLGRITALLRIPSASSVLS
ncbi:MAG: hypothetical protein IT379_31225 [Deltaproteobacteria bacterium]|nr:hypothetical protein [Deltaproteobacteria bacterium]